jgi:tetratricopeptide (TPR) repeat protein
VASLLAILFVLGPATSGAAPKWQRLESRTLTVVGSVPDRALEDIAVRLEQFRDVFSQLLPGAAAAASVPMVVVAFPDERAYKPYYPLFGGKPVPVGGLFLRSPDANYITLNAQSGEQVYRIVFHEYAHAMVANVLPSIPVWLNEGLAEYYSTFEATLSGDSAKVGRPIPEHVNLLRSRSPLPIEALLGVEHDSPLYNEADRRGAFYAQAWALVHYLAVGSEARAGQLSRFVGLLAAGVARPEAFRDAFGADATALEKELSAYIRQLRFRYQVYRFKEAIGVDRAGAVTPIDATEAEAYLGDVLWRTGREDEARARLEAVLRANPGHARAHAALGTMAARGDRLSEAIPHLEKSAAASPDDAVFQYALGAALLRQLLKSQPVERDDPRLRAARDALGRAVSLRTNYAEAMAHLAQALLVGAPDAGRALPLIQGARRLLPARDDYPMIEARAHMELGAYPEARSLLGRLLARSSQPQVKSAAREQLAYVATLERDTRRQDEAPDPASSREGAAAATGSPESTSGIPHGTIPLFRQLQSGEEQAFGTFEALECDRAGAALVISTEGVTRRFLVRALNSVEFLTYREDVSGSVTCGAQSARLPVLVTWKPLTAGTAPARRLDGEAVAVEIVPKGWSPR